MNRQEIEAALEADWESVVSFFHNLFHKASNPEVAAPSPVVEVPAPQAVVDPVVPVVVVPPVEAPVAPVVAATPNPTEASLGVGATDPNYVDPRFPNGVSGLTPDNFDPHKTNLDASDFGKVFKAPAGTTTYTVNVPNGAKAYVVRDSDMRADEMATFSVDDSPPEKVIFTGPIADLTPGSHRVTVACNYEMSFQIQP